MKHLEQVVDYTLRSWEHDWTPFSDTERADLRRKMATAIGEAFTMRERRERIMRSTELGQTITQGRLRAGMTQQDVAERLRVNVTTVGLWENGRHQPTPQRITELQRLLGVALTE